MGNYVHDCFFVVVAVAKLLVVVHFWLVVVVVALVMKLCLPHTLNWTTVPPLDSETGLTVRAQIGYGRKSSYQGSPRATKRA